MKTCSLLLVTVLAFASEVQAESLRVATFNLNWGNRRGDKVLNAIKKADPDLICFQETTEHSERFLRQHLAATHPNFHAVGHRGRYAGERFAFASKHKLKDLKFFPPTAGLFGFYSGRLEMDDKTIHIVNVHLTPFQMQRGGGIRDAMQALSKTEETHKIEIDAIASTIHREDPTIVLGDFNSLSSFIAPQRLSELGLIDAYASQHEHADTHPTWRWPTKPLPLALRIDFVFHSRHFIAIDAEVILEGGSDHSLVVATLKSAGADDSDPAYPEDQ